MNTPQHGFQTRKQIVSDQGSINLRQRLFLTPLTEEGIEVEKKPLTQKIQKLLLETFLFIESGSYSGKFPAVCLAQKVSVYRFGLRCLTFHRSGREAIPSALSESWFLAADLKAVVRAIPRKQFSAKTKIQPLKEDKHGTCSTQS
ncbi:MAG: hypothetical protein AB4426_28860 [Xenococcaceae cyanobacterium]